MGLFGDPFGHARATGADLPHSPPWRESNRPHVPERRGIEKLGKSLEALPRLGLLIVEEIVLFGHSGSLRTHGWGLPDEPVAAVAEPERAPRTSSLLEQGRAPSDGSFLRRSADSGRPRLPCFYGRSPHRQPLSAAERRTNLSCGGRRGRHSGLNRLLGEVPPPQLQCPLEVVLGRPFVVHREVGHGEAVRGAGQPLHVAADALPL